MTAVHPYLKSHPELEIDKQIAHHLPIGAAPDGDLKHRPYNHV